VSAPPIVAGFDPADPHFIANPHPVLHEMREEAPVCHLRDHDKWAVTSYEHVRALLRDPRVGVAPAPDSREGSEQPAPRVVPGQHPLHRAREESQRLLAGWFIRSAPDDHVRFRQLIRAPFARTSVAGRRARAQEIANEQVRRAVARGKIDVVAELAGPIALTTASDLTGIPEPQRPHFAAAARELVPYLDLVPTALSRERGRFAMIDLASRLREILPPAGRAPESETTLLSLLARARDSGELTDDDVVANGAFLFFSSYMSTHHFVGNAVLSLVRNPDQWEQLRSRPDMIATAVEELLRYETSAPVLRRVAWDDIEIAGTTIPRGSAIWLLIGAANRDPAAFDDPDRLDVTRSPNPHLGFGHGGHACMGAALARMEAEVAVGTLVNRVAAPRLERDDLEWENFTVRGLKALPLVFEATR
jgi:cytochrome P450